MTKPTRNSLRADVLQGTLLAATLLVAAAAATLPTGAMRVVRPPIPATARVDEVVDARGITVPAAAYGRIVSLNTVGDRLLLELVEPERLVAITDYTETSHPDRWRFGDRPTIERSDQVESIVALAPDLVIVSPFADEAYMTRLREAGIQVFDLGDARGVESTVRQIVGLGDVLGVPGRAEALAHDVMRQVAALTHAVPREERRPGLYLGVYGDHFSGGTQGTSYADVLRLGGVRDLAAEAGFTGWPQYSPEDLVAIDPPLIVTSAGNAASIRGHGLLKDLRASGPDGRIVELPSGYLVDSGLGLLEAARRLQESLFPERAPARLVD